MVIVAAVCALGAGGFATWGYLTQATAQQNHASALHDQELHEHQEAARFEAEKAADDAHTKEVFAQQKFTPADDRPGLLPL